MLGLLVQFNSIQFINNGRTRRPLTPIKYMEKTASTLRVITEESVLKEICQVIDIVDMTSMLWENILHANLCFLRK